MLDGCKNTSLAVAGRQDAVLDESLAPDFVELLETHDA
jgi:hypothetical protein